MKTRRKIMRTTSPIWNSPETKVHEPPDHSLQSYSYTAKPIIFMVVVGQFKYQTVRPRPWSCRLGGNDSPVRENGCSLHPSPCVAGQSSDCNRRRKNNRIQ